MARTGKLKKKASSIHSRAARRETSPSDNVDKSLKSTPRVEADPRPPSVLSSHMNAGISKKKPKTKLKSRAQRFRQQKGIERAEMVMDQLEAKMSKSLGKTKTANARKANWEDIKAIPITSTESRENARQDDDDIMADGDRPPKATKPVPALPRGASTSTTNLTRLPDHTHEDLDDDGEIT